MIHDTATMKNQMKKKTPQEKDQIRALVQLEQQNNKVG